MDYDRLFQLGDAAYRSARVREAAALFAQAADVAEAGGDVRRRVKARFWQAECLDFFDRDQATPLLLELAACRDPAADPAHVYKANESLINAAISAKPAATTRRLLAGARAYLDGIGHRPWAANLDYLEATLEIARGDGPAALRLSAAGWAAWQDDFPWYTAGGYLGTACEAAFLAGDRAALGQWCARFEARGAEGRTFDQVRLDCARLWRARCQPVGPGALIDPARAFWRDRVAGFPAAEINALRALAIGGDWASLDDIFGRDPMDGTFAVLLLRGDERLCRARAALGLPACDDELAAAPDPPDAPAPGADRPAARRWLTEAAAFYQRAEGWAAARDQRLETTWYGTTIAGRFERLAGLRALAGA